MFSVQSLDRLSFIYKELYETISKLRPSLKYQYRRIHDDINRWEWDITNDCNIAEKEIRSTMFFVDKQLNWIDQEETLSDEHRMFMLCTLYRLIYSHANYWYVLIDGVIFEGLVEPLTERLIKEVGVVLHRSELEILSDLIEPLTDYQYKAISSKRKDAAENMLQVLQSSDHQLALKVSKFTQTYSCIKEYQLMFEELHRTFFEPLIPRTHKKIVDLIQQMDIRELSQEDRLPWNFLPLLWDEILPSMLAKGDFQENQEKRIVKLGLR